MTVSVEVRSSGKGASSFKWKSLDGYTAAERIYSAKVALTALGEMPPRDGVAIIIRREP